MWFYFPICNLHVQFMPRIIKLYLLLQVRAKRRLRPKLLKPKRLYSRDPTQKQRRRSEPPFTSIVPRPSVSPELQNTPEGLHQELTNLTSLQLSSTHSLPSLPWRKSKTPIHWYSLLTSEPISHRLRSQWRNCTTLMLPKLTPLSGLYFWDFSQLHIFIIIACLPGSGSNDETHSKYSLKWPCG